MQRKLYQHIASRLQAFDNCERSDNLEWSRKHHAILDELVRVLMPSGSGFDSGTRFDWDESKPNRLVFITSFHHMNDGGMYDGWTEHTVIITPNLALGFDLRITGRDRNDIKDYIGETFHAALSTDVDDADPQFMATAA